MGENGGKHIRILSDDVVYSQNNTNIFINNIIVIDNIIDDNSFFCISKIEKTINFQRFVKFNTVVILDF